MDRYLNMWLKQLENAGRDKDTIDAYEQSVRLMLQFVGKESHEVTPVDLLSWSDSINNLALSTKILKINTIKSFYTFLFDIDVTIKNVGKALVAPKNVPSEVRYTPSEDEVKAMISKARDAKTKAMLTVLKETGLRFSELQQLKLADFINGNKVVKVLGKGSKLREVPFSQECLDAIDEYIKVREQGVDNLFVSKNGTEIKNDALYKTIKRLAKKCGMANSDDMEVHAFRRYAVSNMYKKGVPQWMVAKIVGHSSVEVEMNHYVSISQEDLLKAVN